MEHPSSRITVFPPRLNTNTRLPGAPIPALSPTSLREAYALAEALFSAAAAHPATSPGYRLFWIAGSTYGSAELPARDGAYGIVGRHSQCSVRLDLDAEIALRHLLVRAVPTADGALFHALDLQTSLAFHLDDDTPQRSVAARGPLAMRLGKYALVALPTGAGAPPKEMPPIAVEHAEGMPYRSAAPRPAQGSSSSSRASRVSILPASRPLHQTAIRLVPEGRASVSGMARVTLVRDGQRTWVDLTEEDLDRGVLIGRASKCDARLGPLLDESISRVHLLLWREASRIFAFDLASINGTFCNGERVRRLELTGRDAVLVLGCKGLTLHWCLRRG